jgi:trehalose/maltose hydrolase-like predicted phosphorylase
MPEGRVPAGTAEHTCEALVFDWHGTAVPHRQADASAVRSRIELLCGAGVHVFVVSDTHVGSVDGQLRARPSGPGRLFLCLNRGSEVFEVTPGGPELAWRRVAAEGLTDKSDSARWAAAWLAQRGVTGSLVLVAGDEFGPVGGVAGSDSLMLVAELRRALVVSVGAEPNGVPTGVRHLGGGPARFLEILDAQLTRRRERRVPSIDDDPSWVLPLPGEPTRERTAEALGTLSNGWAGVRAGREEDGPGTTPLFVVNGAYSGGGDPRLLAGPQWTGLALRPQVEAGRRRVDLRTGVLVRDRPNGSGLRTLRFVSASRPHVVALRAEGPAADLGPGDTLTAPVEGDGFLRDTRGGEVHLARTGEPEGDGITVAARNRQRVSRGRRMIERLAAWTVGSPGTPGWDQALERLNELEGLGFDRLLAEHRGAWARRWADAEVRIDGAGDDELAARFAVFHLLSAAPDRGEAAVGARGLSGPAYGGHVFWDADVFVLPALAAIRPAAARAMLEYRIRRLPAARAAAAALGLAGARFPWESAQDGTDVTPRHGRDPRGQLVPIRTGDLEEHIGADVAWAAWEYAAWTGDPGVLGGPAGDLVVETARYWASRIRLDAAGRGHIDGVIGPDEYHELVDDNAYTNVMARWNLRRAADLIDRVGGSDADTARWRYLADTLVDGYDPESGLYEQFAGYRQLEPLLVAQFAEPPLAADVVLGRERVAGSQLIKQADVLMLHHLVPDEVAPGSLAANLDHYEPRTTHGSSLSPAIHAALFARTHQPERALALFRLAARLDLDDLTRTTAGGLHLAAMGGVWQALAYGFLGLRAHGDVLDIDPSLPDAWQALALRLRFGGHRVGVRADHATLTVACTAPLVLRLGAGPPQRCEPPGHTFPLKGAQS